MSTRLPPVLERRLVIAGWLCASTSGAAILAHTFLGLPMAFTVPFVVLPSSLLLVGAALAGRGRHDQLRAFSRTCAAGARWGLVATMAYDAIRPGLRWVFGFSFDPYRAMTIFGTLMTGRAPADPLSLAAGWTYHFWNGVSFGVMFALMRPQGGVWWGLSWALLLQGLMMLAYPTFLRARLDDPGFLVTGLVGHAFWGVVLGKGLERWASR
jgi:hypothetical protein